ncbi:hypothetical protein [Flavobacterium cellulosilyticum]|uniref:T9SS C-terminal target domain-containing protein n=1 Tax=Flavobacterium cellulosilyticum TaxID=2541731 RepID=A0A4R5CQ04_9FLAO|nr:hypothetical protein [Flavobacterium cellulosilyticum]TDD99672.1 hypothetical protein E0F76_02825 [Flavobacterium cellulosilyticum]
MKNSTLIIGILLLVFCGANAQQEKGIVGLTNWLNKWTEFNPNKVEYGEANQILAGNISENTKLYKKNIYELQGNVFVTKNATLTIEPGTIIIGNYESKGTLIITKGATLIADGLETDPIIFTSNRSIKKAGDWGGIIILGDAPTNKFGNLASLSYDLDPVLSLYGGTNSDSNSGVLRYVRIEYAGKKIKGSSNFNSLLLAGVGKKTIVGNIMVSFSAGNSYEIDGGELSLDKLISYKAIANDYKFNYGTQCFINNSLAIRSSYLSSNTGSRCLDIASYTKKEEVNFTKKQTFVTATNLTLINNSNNLSADIQSGLVKEAVYIGENTNLEFKRTVISGFNPAIVLNSEIEINDEHLNKIKLEKTYFNLCKGNIFLEYNSNNEDLENWYGNAAFSNVYSQAENNETFVDSFNNKSPDYRLRMGRITVSNDD